MPDTKITALTALTAADPANDVLPIVDVSDTTMAASGTTKKISINNVLGCSGTATLASATISGDLTVDTSTLKVDSANNRVGIGTASPTAALQVNLAEVSSAAGTSAIISNTTGGGNRIAALRLQNLTNQWNIRAYGSVTDDLRFGSGTAGSEVDYLSIGNTGIFTWSNVGGVAGTAMTLNSTGLGVGVTPAAGRGAVQLSAGIGFPATQVASSDANTLDDYEEGTWTPAIEGTTTAGSGTYSNQVGRYTKIGNQVTILARLSWSAHTGTGNMVISGFPFTIANVNNLIPSGAIGYTANIAINAGNLLMIGGDPNSSKAFFWQTPTGGGSTSTVPLDTAGDVAFSMTYFV